MGFVVYYFIATIASMISAFIFSDQINVTYESILPLVMIGFSVFQAVYFHNHREKKDFNINNDSPLTEDEWAVLSVYLRNSYIISIPLYIPFILYFSIWVKILSAFIYLIALGAGPFFWRIRNRDKLIQRLNDEDKELAEQLKKEESGKY